ncbi:MAG: hypothetical protein JO102_02880, partial [Elusimicrobia bacterium]|nr:hypothetical protein [Elusimicrobiota bacterium]
MSRRLVFFIAAVALSWPSRAAEPQPSPESRKPGIRTEFGDVQIDNLGIGRTYNLRDLAGTPLKVTNTGPDSVNLVMSVEIPKPDTIAPQRRELGFKPVPSLDWVSLGRSQFIVPPGDSAYTDVIIKIPDDPSLYGKKFQADIYSRTTGGDAFLHLGVWSHLQMSIVRSPEDQAQIEKNKKRGIVGS